MNISINGIQLIKNFEQLSLKAYLCAAGVLTIGYGSTVGVKPGMIITAKEADERLAKDLRGFTSAVNAVLGSTTVNQHQYDALCSLCFNIGANAFANSTVARLVRANPADKAISAAFLMWNKITVIVQGKRGKVVSKGLHLRRVKEATYYFS